MSPPLRDTAGAKAAAALRSRISAGHLAPGSKLSEQEFAHELGVSRNTLRQVFAELTEESLVEKFPNRGVFVAQPTADDVREIYCTRAVIEPAAVLWGRIRPGLDDQVRAVLESAVRGKAIGEARVMGDANQAFHRLLLSMTGSETLLTVMDRLLAQMRLVFHSMAQEPEFHSHYVERNVHVWDLVMADQRAAAADELRRYFTDAREELLSHLNA